MQWGHIKTLFILSFLILNIYLLSQFMEKQSDSDRAFLENGDEASLEEQLKSENITIHPNLEQGETESTYINISPRTFTDKETNELKKLENLAMEVIDHNFILGQFEEPLELPINPTSENVSNLIAPYILYLDEYSYWKWDEELNVIIFFQEITDNKTVYHNQDALLLVYLNDDNQITHYTQTMLGESEQQGKPETIIPSLKAIERLYDRQELSQDEEVTEVQLGYLSRIETEGTKVFAPTWKVTIKNSESEQDYFVNAIEGLIYEDSDLEFIKRALENNITKILTLPEEHELKESALEKLNHRLEPENRSETE